MKEVKTFDYKMIFSNDCCPFGQSFANISVYLRISGCPAIEYSTFHPCSPSIVSPYATEINEETMNRPTQTNYW